MKTKILLGIIALLWVLPTPVGAQENDTAWYFAVGEGQLVAYTVSGEVNVLLEAGVNNSIYGWRLGPQSALVALAEAEGLYYYYHLTPDTARLLTFDSEMDGLPQASVSAGKLAAYREPYAVLILSDRVPSGLLVDMEAGLVTPLEYQMYYPMTMYSARFSADGQSLRYMGSTPDENQTWMLQEHDLTSGKESTIHTLAPQAGKPYITTDTYGEQWIVSVRGDAGYSDILLGSDGSSEVLPRDQIMEGSTFTQLFKDDIIAFVPCDSQCWMLLNPGTPNESSVFVVPRITARIEPVARIDDLTLLVKIKSDYLLLEDESGKGFKPAVMLGYSALGQVIPTLGKELWSGRWLVTVDQPTNPTMYRVWDSISKDFVLEGGPGEADVFWIAALTYGSGGVLVSERTLAEGRAQLYRTVDGAVIELPPLVSGDYVDVLPDGTVLYYQFYDDKTLVSGIHRYDPDTETYTLLVEGMKPIQLE